MVQDGLILTCRTHGRTDTQTLVAEVDLLSQNRSSDSAPVGILLATAAVRRPGPAHF